MAYSLKVLLSFSLFARQPVRLFACPPSSLFALVYVYHFLHLRDIGFQLVLNAEFQGLDTIWTRTASSLQSYLYGIIWSNFNKFNVATVLLKERLYLVNRLFDFLYNFFHIYNFTLFRPFLSEARWHCVFQLPLPDWRQVVRTFFPLCLQIPSRLAYRCLRCRRLTSRLESVREVRCP